MHGSLPGSGSGAVGAALLLQLSFCTTRIRGPEDWLSLIEPLLPFRNRRPLSREAAFGSIEMVGRGGGCLDGRAERDGIGR